LFCLLLRFPEREGNLSARQTGVCDRPHDYRV